MFELIPFECRPHRMVPMDPFREMNEFLLGTQAKMPSGFISTDIVDSGDAFELTAELPGCKKEDIAISIEDELLTLSAEHKQESEEKKPNYVRRERFCGSYKRSFNISGIDAEHIEASYCDGVLNVKLPKRKEEIPASRTIEIR